MNKIRIGFAGYGMIGRVHALGYRELGHYYPKSLPVVNSAGVCTSSVDTAIRAAEDTRIQFWMNQLDRPMIHNLYTFLSAIPQDHDPEPSIADGLAVQRVISAAYASAKSNQWVEVKS